MGDLALVKLHEDGEHLVLAGADGTRYTLPITEELRAAVRRDRAHLEHLRAENVALSPREIQSRLRAGQTVDAVAAAAGVTAEQIERYAGPVVAEQQFVIDQVRSGTHGGSESLDALVVRRLGARAADPEAVEWSATRENGAPWLVTALFEINETLRTAQWTYQVANRMLVAIDDEARWLQADEPLPAETDAPLDRTGGGRSATPAAAETDDLLSELTSRRGLRTTPPERPAAAGDDLPFEDFDPPLVVDIDPIGADVVTFAPRGERTHSRPAPLLWDGPHTPPKHPASGPEDDTEVVPPPTDPKPPRKGRAKVPSLDEIVFGAKPRT